MSRKKQVQSLFKNNEVKNLAGNFFWLTMLRVVSQLFPLITLPYLARVIGVDCFGDIAFAASVIIYFQTITEFGFNYTATRDVAQHRDDLTFISSLFANVMAAKLLLMILSALILFICIYFFPIFHEKEQLLWLSFLIIPGYVMFPEWFFQGMEKMRYITFLNLLSRLIFTILIFFVIKEKSDYIYQPLLTAVGSFVGGIISIYFIYTKFHVKFVIPSLDKIRDVIKNSWSMFVSLLMPNLFTNFSVILLGAYHGSYATGIYNAGYRFVALADQFSQVFSRTFYPYLARKIDKHKFFVMITGSISTIVGIILFFGADLLVKIFYTEEFKPAVIVIKIMSIVPFFLFLLNTYGAVYLVIKHKENIYRNIIFFTSILGFILTWITTVKFAYIGVAMVITIIWGIEGLLTWHFAKKSNKEASV